MLPAEPQDALLARAGGNPLYAEEYVRMLADRGFLGRRRAAGSWRSAELPMPESVQGIIAARLDALPPAEKALLQDAAVVGKVVWVGALGRERAERGDVDERLHALERKEFVRRERRSSVADETEYAFRHALVRDVAYGQIPRIERARKHRAAAEWIEELSVERSQDHAQLAAHHWLQALDLSRAAGAVDVDLEARARSALVVAGDRAIRLSATAAAGELYGHALALVSADDPQRPALLLRHGRARRARVSMRTPSLPRRPSSCSRQAMSRPPRRRFWLDAGSPGTRDAPDDAAALFRAGAGARLRSARVHGPRRSYTGPMR